MTEQEIVGDIFAAAEEVVHQERRRRREIWRGAGEFAFRTCKEQGDWAELCFMARARQMGLTVLKPYGDSSAYDVRIDVGGRLLRVQTKSTTFGGVERSRVTWWGQEGRRIARAQWIIPRYI